MYKKVFPPFYSRFLSGHSLVAAIPPSLSMSAPPTKKHCRHVRTHTYTCSSQSFRRRGSDTHAGMARNLSSFRSVGGAVFAVMNAAAQTEQSPPPDRRTSMLIAKVAEGGQTLSIPPRDSFGYAVKGGLTYCDFRVTPCQSH